jgi:HAD superfamily hydrolase (TIGR01509 family)
MDYQLRTKRMTDQIFDAVLFDMDGVLIDTHEAVTAFWLRLAERCGVTLSDQDFTLHIYGQPAAQTLELFFPQIDPALWQQALADLDAEEAVAHYVPMAGVLDVLDTLRRAAVPTALVTSAAPSKVKAVLSQLGLERTFGTVVTAYDVARGKPDPTCYRLAAARLGVAAARCVVFEDSRSGVQAAVGAGAHCVGINRQPDILHAVGAAHVIPDFSFIAAELQAHRLTLCAAPDHRLVFQSSAT